MNRLSTSVRDLVAAAVMGAGADLEDVQVRDAGRRRLVRISVDTDTGISLDQVAAVSRAVSAVLDDSDVLGDRPYVLEVTSPGVTRPLTEPRHWRRNTGRLVRVARRSGGAALTGRIVASTQATATVDVGGSLVELPFADVARAVVQVELRAEGEQPHGH